MVVGLDTYCVPANERLQGAAIELLLLVGVGSATDEREESPPLTGSPGTINFASVVAVLSCPPTSNSTSSAREKAYAEVTSYLCLVVKVAARLVAALQVAAWQVAAGLVAAHRFAARQLAARRGQPRRQFSGWVPMHGCCCCGCVTVTLLLFNTIFYTTV